jgi:hypothetical protein
VEAVEEGRDKVGKVELWGSATMPIGSGQQMLRVVLGGIMLDEVMRGRVGKR